MNKIVKKYRKSKGFTLVELLIVIIIIGILAGMMMLSTGSATDKAEATKIVSDMRNIKSACLMYYADNGVWPTATIDNVKPYLDQDPSSYDLKEGTASGDLYVTYSQAAKMTAGVKSKLTDMTSDAGLKAGPTSTDYTGDDEVGMVVRRSTN
ncbi:MAG: prepilin-type N-terminal cleavage/methylation domain-containing protein [Synergistaceae bacterium]|nr:prepilin-type N-terminal cleavage/methylation domain-containing protein [Synergistaceae bacterium]